MGFKLKSGNKVDFKMIGSSPVRNMKDGDYSHSFEKPGPPQTTKFTHNWDGVDESKNTLERGSTGLTENKGFGGDATSLIQEKNEEKQELKDATDGKGVKKDADGNPITNDDDNTTGGSAGAELKTTSDKYTPEGDLKEDDKKWHEKDAFRNTGVGHITDAVKSISRGIKNIRAKRAAKKNRDNIGEKLKSSVRESKSKKAEKSTSTDPITEGIKLDTKKGKKAFRKNTVIKNGKTYRKLTKEQKMSKASKMTDQELMDSYEKKHGNLKG